MKNLSDLKRRLEKGDSIQIFTMGKMSAHQLVQTILFEFAEFDYGKVERGQPSSKNELAKVAKAAAFLSSANLWVHDGKAPTYGKEGHDSYMVITHDLGITFRHGNPSSVLP